ncbi:Mandelamide hydrolase [Aquisphaera giovannonii]|uniref:Mandelamide hydrolase n=1 Tax=Aquisphaera giovannonii TaxID=406548 RepID=A0A5B9W7P6_9BACT|nr:amidase [Aquisphaera giovannonii]QEH36264.1 Mandelamide hydrolase [Aquisphaera giovannonii]
MNAFKDEDEGIRGIGRAIREGRMSCEEAVQACLDRIDERDDSIRAWVAVDREGALARARDLDAELRAGRDLGPLHGIPLGIKDIIDVRGLPTRCGSPRPSDRPAEADARIVARLREAGAVILGKTVTTPFAWIDPPPTRNPWDLSRTPGGSSSGSAAAVAAGMCLGAIGTQTGGSITRPASFCGVAGMKPTYGRLPVDGILPLAPSLDHPGPIADDVAGLRVLFEAMCPPEDLGEFVPSLRPKLDETPPRLGRLAGFFDDRADADLRWATGAYLRWFEAWDGATVIELEPSDVFEAILKHHRTILAAEAYAVHRERFSLLPEAYPPRIAELIQEGERIRSKDVEAALDARPGLVARFLELFEGDDAPDALIAPATTEYPPDPSTTGDPAFNSPWSYLGFPAVSFPIGRSESGLPLAVQLIDGPGTDLGLLELAEWCEWKNQDAYRRFRDTDDG